MSGDDDDGTVIIIRRKAQKALESLKKPVFSVQRWHLVAIALVAFLVGIGVAV